MCNKKKAVRYLQGMYGYTTQHEREPALLSSKCRDRILHFEGFPLVDVVEGFLAGHDNVLFANLAHREASVAPHLPVIPTAMIVRSADTFYSTQDIPRKGMLRIEHGC